MQQYNRFILILILFIPFIIHAQTVIGVSGGINFAQFSGKDAEIESQELKPILGVGAGIFFDIPVIQHLSFRPGIFYSKKGAKYEQVDSLVSFTFDYIEFPLFMQYKLSASPKFGLLLLAGPYLGHNFNAMTDYDKVIESGDISIKDSIRDWDLGFIIGAGFLLFERVEIIGQYSMGLSNFNDVDNPPEMKNQTIEIRASFRIPQ
jgi:hypothetical protein